jgi:hypothetical protein
VHKYCVLRTVLKFAVGAKFLPDNAKNQDQVRVLGGSDWEIFIFSAGYSVSKRWVDGSMGRVGGAEWSE